jgi:hypothetical protein
MARLVTAPTLARALSIGRAALMRCLLLAALLCQGIVAHAGRSCEAAQPPRTETVVRGLQLAERTQAALQASGADVVLLARAGQDLGRHGLRWSHLGFAFRRADGDGWLVLHKLNACGTATGDLYLQGLGPFFLDDLWRFEAAWVVPTPAVQARLLALLRDRAQAVRLQHRPYSMVSHAWSTRYQQSNQWAIETLAAAMEPQTIATREQALAWLQFKGYEPTALQLGPLTRLGGRMTAANVAFDDHPNAKRFADRIETVTVDSVFAWLARAGLGGAPVVLPP